MPLIQAQMVRGKPAASASGHPFQGVGLGNEQVVQVHRHQICGQDHFHRDGGGEAHLGAGGRWFNDGHVLMMDRRPEHEALPPPPVLPYFRSPSNLLGNNIISETAKIERDKSSKSLKKKPEGLLKFYSKSQTRSLAAHCSLLTIKPGCQRWRCPPAPGWRLPRWPHRKSPDMPMDNSGKGVPPRSCSRSRSSRRAWK